MPHVDFSQFVIQRTATALCHYSSSSSSTNTAQDDRASSYNDGLKRPLVLWRGDMECTERCRPSFKALLRPPKRVLGH
ncbi:hypothetical protein SRHO_G00157620 [Serrasalmus rhombeus]